MPYKVWNEKLRIKLQQWYKIYADSGCDAEKVCSEYQQIVLLKNVTTYKCKIEFLIF